MPGVPPTRFAYLGPEGTFADAALRTIPAAARGTALPKLTVHAAIEAVRTGDADVGVPRLGDLSRKRNLALWLAHRCNWGSILLLDDDMRDLSPRTVQRATETLPSGGAVGMVAEDFPDNSVVCHARRRARRPQKVFVSGSALVIDTTAVDSFFPEVYNEDWLFLYDRVQEGRVAAVGTVRQLRYEPYADPSRAESEEFGDTLAEGLMGLLHRNESVERALQRSWWSGVLRERRRMLEDLAGRLQRMPAEESALTAVQWAAKRSESFSAHSFTDFVDRWRQDRDALPRRLADRPRTASLEEALRDLGLEAKVHARPEQRDRTPELSNA